MLIDRMMRCETMALWPLRAKQRWVACGQFYGDLWRGRGGVVSRKERERGERAKKKKEEKSIIWNRLR